MTESHIEGQPISRTWSLLTMLICMVVAIAMNETVANGHGKAIFFGLFMAAFISKIAQKGVHKAKIKIFLLSVFAFHLAIIFIAPKDANYPGGILFPAGILDLVVWYFVFKQVAKAV